MNLKEAQEYQNKLNKAEKSLKLREEVGQRGQILSLFNLCRGSVCKTLTMYEVFGVLEV